MATEAGSDLRCGIGARLRSARERAGMSILQAAERLHADPRVLEALEAERFEELGAAVFVRGHIRRYAELVRENSQELQDVYAASSHAVARPDLTRIPTTNGSRSTDPGRLLVPGLVFVIIVGLVGLVWWFLTDLRLPGAASMAKTDDASGGVITEPAQEVDADVPSVVTETSEPVPPAPSPATSAKTRAEGGAPAGAASVEGANASAPRVVAQAPARTPAASSAPISVAPSSTPASGAPRVASATPAPGQTSVAPRTSGSTPAQSAATTSTARTASSTPAAGSAPPQSGPPVPSRSVAPASAATASINTPSSTSRAPQVAQTAPMGAAPSSGTSTSFEAAATPPASEVPAAPAPARGKLTEVTLRFNGDSWAEVYDAKGAKIFYDIGSADSVKTLSGAPPLRVILGNPTGVAMEINGKSMTVPTVKGDNGVQFTVFRNGRLSRGRAAPSAQ